MKTKAEKVDKESVKRENKIVAKVASPKNKIAQGLVLFKTEKDLNRKPMKT